MVVELSPTPATVVVVGGDAVVGQALELLLRDATYSVKFVDLSTFHAPQSLEEARLMVLGPGLNADERRRVLASVWGRTNAKSILVLELVAGAQETQIEDMHFLVPWPSRPEDLKQKIEFTLRADPLRARSPDEASVYGEKETHGA